MKYEVTAVYREDVGARLAPPYSEWLTFELDEYSVMIYAMTCFINRHFGDCHHRAEKFVYEVVHHGVLHLIDTPRMFAFLPDESVVSVFHVEVTF
jgi:hypothetical protein